jgi:hypothetical protein
MTMRGNFVSQIEVSGLAPLHSGDDVVGAGVTDLVIEILSDSEAALSARVRALEADIAAYRELVQVALSELARLTKVTNRQSARLAELLDLARREQRDVYRADRGEEHAA